MVNKRRPIPVPGYEAPDLERSAIRNVNGQPVRAAVARALEKMQQDAVAAVGSSFAICSGYRPYDTQVRVYNGFLNDQGREYADSYSARPGHSEHQLGLAVDLVAENEGCALDTWAATPAGQWVHANAHKYGFVLRYPEGRQYITGYAYESWHFRFVGVEMAMEMKQSGEITLEEFFGLPAAPGYAK
ncbi:MAG: M15 family metallopeptidase [Microbacteriaceae bacterium]|nr:M15 family metallopeptidase [Microbacteriaceae bacterium]